MAIGLLGALLPDMSCSVRTCGECRGWGADAEPPVVPMLGGGEGGARPATAWTAYGDKEKSHRERGEINRKRKCVDLRADRWLQSTGARMVPVW